MDWGDVAKIGIGTLAGGPVVGALVGKNIYENNSAEQMGDLQKAALEKARLQTNAVAQQQYANRMHALDQVLAMYAPVNNRMRSFQNAPAGLDTLAGGANYQSFGKPTFAAAPLSSLDLQNPENIRTEQVNSGGLVDPNYVPMTPEEEAKMRAYQADFAKKRDRSAIESAVRNVNPLFRGAASNLMSNLGTR